MLNVVFGQGRDTNFRNFVMSRHGLEKYGLLSLMSGKITIIPFSTKLSGKKHISCLEILKSNQCLCQCFLPIFFSKLKLARLSWYLFRIFFDKQKNEIRTGFPSKLKQEVVK